MIKRIALLTLLSCLLAACGNKGPLVHPDAPAATEHPAAAPADGAAAGTPASQP